MQKFPNFVAMPNSPEPIGDGIVIAAEPHTLQQHRAVIVYGRYRVDGNFLRRFGSDPLGLVLITVIGQDIPIVRSGIARANLVPQPDAKQSRENDHAGRGGYFNVDVSAQLQLPDALHRFWILASLGYHLSNVGIVEIPQ